MAQEARGSIPGSHNQHRTMLYALSTCIWCRRTRQFLEDNSVQFDYIYVDLLQGAEREEVLAQVGKWNPALSFPTLVVDDAKSVIGSQLDAIKELLEL